MGKRGNPAIIASDDPSLWLSCRIITPNLQRAYQFAFGGDASFFSFTRNMDREEIWKLARLIHASSPDRLVFIDHVPHPTALILALEQCYGSRALPPVYFHVYGDFTLYSQEWLALSSLLKGTRLRFIAASERQKALISQFMLDPDCASEICPFPVDRASYRFEPGLREAWRDKLGVSREEALLVYAGRMSLQKNVSRLAAEVASVSQRLGTPIRLVCAGGFDDLGAPFFGVRLRAGYCFHQWESTLAEMPASVRERIRYVGELGPGELKGLYHAADAYVSLSLHHDEDFGMAPAEALCCGTPAVLTDWGGYASFVERAPATGPAQEGENLPSVQLVSARIGEKGLSIRSESMFRSLFRVLAAEDSGRHKRSERYLSRFSIEAAGAILERLHSVRAPEFQGFSWLLEKHHEVMTRAIPFREGPKRNTFYEAIYAKYTANELH